VFDSEPPLRVMRSTTFRSVERPATVGKENPECRALGIRARMTAYRHPRRRAYFRPRDTTDLPASLRGLIDQTVTIRFAGMAQPTSRDARHRLYAMDRGRFRLGTIRPERDFDFLD